jgi:hypothetical protein
MDTMKLARVAFVAGLVVVLLRPGIARADNTTCANATWTMPDGSGNSGTFAAAETRWFRFAVKADRSYAIMSDNPNPDAAIAGGIFPLQSDCAGTAVPGTQGNIAFVEPEPRSGVSIWTRLAFISTSATDVFFGVVGNAAGQAYRVRVEETTQFNTFFSTFGGFETLYRFTNTTNMNPLTVTLKLVSDAGATVGNTTFTIPANSSAPTRLTGPTDLNVADNTAGFSIITHNGPPGALAADAFLRSATAVLPLKIVNGRQQR